MYTEIELSEFTIRARLKIGDLAEKITEHLQHGVEVDDMIMESAALRSFLNSVNSDTQTWDKQDLYRRMEYFTSLHDLVDKPARPGDWNNQFRSTPQVIKRGCNYIELPTNQEGFLYLKDGEISFVLNGEITLNDLPNG
jgi:hypothetical protein